MLSKVKHLYFRGSATRRNNQRFFAPLGMTIGLAGFQRFNAFAISFDPWNAKPILNFRTKITNGGFTYATCCWNQSARLQLIDKNR